jgi:hypothetical protein
VLIRELSIREQLEGAGFELVTSQKAEQVTHLVLRPRNLRFARDAASEEEWPEYHWAEDGLLTHVIWDGLDLEEMSPNETEACLWDLLYLTGPTIPAPIPEEFHGFRRDWLEDVFTFISRWGLLDYGEYVERDQPSDGVRALSEWIFAAEEVSILLELMSLTEQGIVAPPERFLDMVRWLDLNVHPIYPTQIDRGLPTWDSILVSPGWHESLIESVKAGNGLRLQREAVARMLVGIGAAPEYRRVQDEVPSFAQTYIWDENGRRSLVRARGVREIVATQARALFTSPELNLYVCAVCQSPFRLDDGQRRPRRGVKALCSQECRQLAKQESNRASWHRNKQRWTAKGEGAV